MSYEKTGADPKIVVFWYLVDSLFASIQARSLTIAKNLKNDKGEPAIYEYAILDDEKPLFLEYLKKACNEVFSKLSNLTYNVADTEVFNADYSGNGVSVAKKILDKEGYKTDILRDVDGNIEEMLKAHVLASWFKNNHLNDTAAVYLADLDERKKSLLDMIYKLHKPALT